MVDYKQWSAAERLASLALTNEAKRRGLLEAPHACRICGETRGILHTHNSNYDVTLALTPKMLNGTATEEEVARVKEVLMPVCWRCHMMIHKKGHHPLSWEKYIEAIKSGVRFRPVYRGNAWEELNQHIID